MHSATDRGLSRADLYVMAALVALAGTVLILWSHLGHELIPVRAGIGYDGKTYAAVTADPMGTFLGGTLDVHRVQRVVPSLIVFVMLGPFGLHTSAGAVVIGFQVLNYVLMGLAVLLWWQIARRLDLSRAAGWVGFTALLVNYGVLKYAAYNPVLTDTSGFLLGLAVVWCVVFKRPGLLPWVAVIGAFTWPTVTYSALGLYVLSRPAGPLKPSRWWGVAVAAAFAIAVPAGAVYTYRCGTDCASTLAYESVFPSLLPLSVLLLVAWIYLAFRPVVQLLTIPAVLRAVHWPRLLVAVALMVLIVLVQRHLADPSFRTVSRTLYNTALGGIAKPGGFIVVPAVYFGPAVLLVVMTWGRAVRAASQLGAGVVGLLLGFLLIALTSEARLLMNEWPLFVLLAAIVVDKLGWGRFEAVVFGLLALVASRIWFPVFHGAYTGDWHAYPDQYYGMSLGLKMTGLSYTIMTLGCLACAAVIFWLLRRRAGSVVPG